MKKGSRPTNKDCDADTVVSALSYDEIYHTIQKSETSGKIHEKLPTRPLSTLKEITST